MKFRTPAPFQVHCKVTAIFPSSIAVAVSPYCWLFIPSSQPIKTLLIVRPANDNLFILPFNQSHKDLSRDCHCFNDCLISKVWAQISNLLSYIQISKRASAAIKISSTIRQWIVISDSDRLSTQKCVKDILTGISPASNTLYAP